MGRTKTYRIDESEVPPEIARLKDEHQHTLLDDIYSRVLCMLGYTWSERTHPVSESEIPKDIMQLTDLESGFYHFKFK